MTLVPRRMIHKARTDRPGPNKKGTHQRQAEGNDDGDQDDD